MKEDAIKKKNDWQCKALSLLPIKKNNQSESKKQNLARRSRLKFIRFFMSSHSRNQGVNRAGDRT